MGLLQVNFSLLENLLLDLFLPVTIKIKRNLPTLPKKNLIDSGLEMDLDLETPELWSATADIASSAATMKVLYMMIVIMMIVTMTMTAMHTDPEVSILENEYQ